MTLFHPGDKFPALTVALPGRDSPQVWGAGRAGGV